MPVNNLGAARSYKIFRVVLDLLMACSLRQHLRAETAQGSHLRRDNIPTVGGAP